MLVSCAAYQNGKKIADIAESEIHDYVSRPDTFVWVALRDPDRAKLDEMKQAFGLHALAVEDARHGHQRPKIEEYGDSVFVVLHMIEMDPSGALKVGELDIFVGRNYVLSVRTGAEKGFQEVRARSEREPALLSHGASFVLYALMDAAVDRYFPVLQALEVELEGIEERIFEGASPRRNLRSLYALKQKLVTMKHAIAPLLESTGKLHGGRVPQICVGSQDYFRDVVDHLGRINNTIDPMRDTIGTAISVNLSMVTIEDNEVTKRFAAWAAIFAVCTAFAGIWGMNFEHMPELKWRYGYWAAVGLIASLCGLLYYRFRRAGWV
jgi:magnesium transporter